MKLPETLSRRAIIETFDQLAPVTWEKLFEREDCNGIVKYRVTGDYKAKAYYLTSGIMEWLVREGHYTLDQFERDPKVGGELPAHPPVRRLAMA